MTKAISCTLFLLFISCNALVAQSTSETKYEMEDYKITFPYAFERSSQTIESKLGPLLMIMASYEPKITHGDSNYVYLIMETSYPDSTVHSDKTEQLENVFNGAINGAVNNVNGKLIKVTKGMSGIYPNRTIEIDYQNGLAIIKMQLVLRKSKMIMIQTITNTQNYPNAAATKFLESFEIK